MHRFCRKIGKQVWNDCHKIVSITPYKADSSCILLFIALGLTVWTPDAEVVTNILCKVYGLSTTWCTIKIETGES